MAFKGALAWVAAAGELAAPLQLDKPAIKLS